MNQCLMFIIEEFYVIMILSPNVFICIANANAIVICCIFCFSCVGGTDNMKHHNEVELFESIDPNVSTPPDGLCS